MRILIDYQQLKMFTTVIRNLNSKFKSVIDYSWMVIDYQQLLNVLIQILKPVIDYTNLVIDYQRRILQNNFQESHMLK